MGIAIHLCQPDGRKACGACCGMYNVAGADRERIVALLRARTDRFRDVCDVRDQASLAAYKTERLALEAPEKLLPLLRNCPFLGVLDDATGRVGCMVHPKVNDGIDGRDCGVYDRETCETYLCAAYTLLSLEERRLVIAACGDDSFLYGLVLNDVRFLRALFEGAAEITGMWPRGERLFVPEVLTTVRRYLELKGDWPWGDPEAGIIGAWLPEGEHDVVRREIDYAALGCERSRFDVVLRALGSHFDDVDDLREAEAVVYGCIHDFAMAWERVVASSVPR